MNRERTVDRKKRLANERRILTEKIMNHRHQGNSVTDTCDKFNISRPTYYKYLRAHGYNDFCKTHIYTRYVGSHPETISTLIPTPVCHQNKPKPNSKPKSKPKSKSTSPKTKPPPAPKIKTNNKIKTKKTPVKRVKKTKLDTSEDTSEDTEEYTIVDNLYREETKNVVSSALKKYNL
jgi:hypothetical protein